ncbi:hypothetical protein [Nonomuraea sp. KM90]|uniref:hypothetical protein n=1 Tax=Nonomuraea sp. KM90 TaxID=3457428 RepID=UPI003FCD92D9
MSKFTYTDREGDRLTIESDNVEPGAATFVSSDSGAFVAVADLPTIVAELYKAARQEPPILLPRFSPEMSWVTEGGYVRTLLTPGELMTPDDIRDLCSWYASAADLVEAEAERQRAEAERQEVERLTALIDPWATAEANARAILAAGYTRSES